MFAGVCRPHGLAAGAHRHTQATSAGPAHQSEAPTDDSAVSHGRSGSGGAGQDVTQVSVITSRLSLISST